MNENKKKYFFSRWLENKYWRTSTIWYIFSTM